MQICREPQQLPQFFQSSIATIESHLHYSTKECYYQQHIYVALKALPTSSGYSYIPILTITWQSVLFP